MNREVVLLGTPCYSIFASAKGAVDRKLESEGKLVFINSIDDISKIRIEKKQIKDVKLENHALLDFFVDLTESQRTDLSSSLTSI